jgi:hypothetical protein
VTLHLELKDEKTTQIGAPAKQTELLSLKVDCYRTMKHGLISDDELRIMRQMKSQVPQKLVLDMHSSQV